MTYDANDRYVLLFGGFNGTSYLSDTWEFSHGLWVQLSTSPSPSPRANAAMTYDSEDNYLVLFGGRNSGGALGDTWQFVGGTWSQLNPTTSPSARYGAGIVDAPNNSKGSKGGQPNLVLLLGGTNGAVFYGDTWGFLGGRWTLFNASAPNPTPFAFGGLSNDVDDGVPITFAGLGAGGPLADFWDYRAVNFTSIPPANYSVTFTESGLPSGTTWSATLGDMTETSMASSIAFTEINGTYDYSVGAVAGFTSAPTSGSVPVAGGPEAVAYTSLAPGTHSVTFGETGLSSGPPGRSR